MRSRALVRRLSRSPVRRVHHFASARSLSLEAMDPMRQDELRHMTDDAVPRALIGGGWGSRRPTLLQMWLIQWAPGASLAGWVLAVVVLQRLGRDGNALAFIFLGMFADRRSGQRSPSVPSPCSFSSDRWWLRWRERPRDCGRRFLRRLARLRSWQSPSSAGGYSAHSTRVENLRPDSTSLLSWRCASLSA